MDEEGDKSLRSKSLELYHQTSLVLRLGPEVPLSV